MQKNKFQNIAGGGKPKASSELERVPESERVLESEDALMLDRAEEREEAPQLRETPDGLALVSGDQMIRADFSGMLRRVQPNNLNRELIVKASRFKKADPNRQLTAIDATAGLGEDSLLLAAAGFRVTMFEKDPMIAALLDDGLHRAAADSRLAEIAARMELIRGDSIRYLKALAAAQAAASPAGKPGASENAGLRPDLILLDPMFPERTKSGLVKKKFQMIHLLEQPCEDEEELLEAAIAACPRKIVIKRPLKGPYLGGRKPGYSLKGKKIRCDCIVL